LWLTCVHNESLAWSTLGLHDDTTRLDRIHDYIVTRSTKVSNGLAVWWELSGRNTREDDAMNISFA
jgi:hypothetical protein